MELLILFFKLLEQILLLTLFTLALIYARRFIAVALLIVFWQIYSIAYFYFELTPSIHESFTSASKLLASFLRNPENQIFLIGFVGFAFMFLKTLFLGQRAYFAARDAIAFERAIRQRHENREQVEQVQEELRQFFALLADTDDDDDAVAEFWFQALLKSVRPRPRPFENDQEGRGYQPIFSLRKPFVTRKTRRILATFQCPFEAEEDQGCQTRDSGCPYGHQTGVVSPPAHALKALPSYLCTDHLISRCINFASQVCPKGLHPVTFDELLNLADFERRHQEQIEAYFGNDRHRECSVCLEKVLGKRLTWKRRFVLLENCPHIFCVVCLVQWSVESYRRNFLQLEGRFETSCPICRVVFRKVNFRRNVPSDLQ